MDVTNGIFLAKSLKFEHDMVLYIHITRAHIDHIKSTLRSVRYCWHSIHFIASKELVFLSVKSYLSATEL